MRNAMWVGGGITGMGEIPMLGVREKGIAKVIRDIFRNGEQGFFYDPSDLKTQYQYAAGTAAVNTTGQPLGLVLDKSKGLVLGTEIISGGNFEGGLILTKIDTPSAISTWTLNTNNPISGLQDGLLSVTQAASTRPALYAPSPQSKQGVYEELSFDYKVISGSVNVSGVYNGGGVDVINKALSGTGRFSHRYFRSGTDTGVYIYFGNTLGSFQIDNVSVKQILGNHAYQTTSAARPIFRQKPILGSELVTTKLISGQPATGSTQFYAMPSRMAQLSAGKTYNISYTVKDYAGTGSVGLAGAAPAGVVQKNHNANGMYSSIQTPNANGYFVFFTSATNTANFSDISVKEITGYLTDQSYLAFDGVDDKLTTNLPSALTKCTVLRSVPGVGTQVKYNQTLPMLYEDSSNHSGLVAIDRALTRKEQLRLMEELDKRAGAVGFDTTTFKMFDGITQGFVYDPNDLSTMYRDVAGTTPITAIGQSVGLILDKSKGLALGAEVLTNGNFANGKTGWTDVRNWWSIVGGRAYHPYSDTYNELKQSVASMANKFVKVSFDVQVVQGSAIVGLSAANVGGQTFGVGTHSITIYAIPSETSYFFVGRASGTTSEFYLDNISVKELAGNHAYQTTSASRPILRQNATTGAYYLEFDGSDDFLVTNNINFTSTDKVSLFAGVGKMSDKSSGAVAELSDSTMTNNGSFGLFAPNVGSDVTGFLKGSGSRSTSSLDGYVAPASVLVTAKFDISGNNKQHLKVNSAVRTSTASVGTGSFGNYPLYIGRRGGTQYPLNGHIYGLIGIGKLTSDSETEAIEKELAKRTGVTLNV